MKIVTVSSKRQITIPKDLLLSLKLQPRGRLLLEQENGSLSIKPLKKSITERTAGSLSKYVSSSKKGLPFSKILRETKRRTTRKLVHE